MNKLWIVVLFLTFCWGCGDGNPNAQPEGGHVTQNSDIDKFFNYGPTEVPPLSAKEKKVAATKWLVKDVQRGWSEFVYQLSYGDGGKRGFDEKKIGKSWVIVTIQDNTGGRHWLMATSGGSFYAALSTLVAGDHVHLPVSKEGDSINSEAVALSRARAVALRRGDGYDGYGMEIDGHNEDNKYYEVDEDFQDVRLGKPVRL